MKKIFAYFGYVLSVALVGALTACNPQEVVNEDTATLSIKTFFPAKVVANQPMTVNGNGMDGVREVVFPGGVTVTSLEHVGNGMIRLTAPSGIASEGGPLTVRSADGEAVSRFDLTVGNPVVAGYSKQEGESVEFGELFYIYGKDLEFISSVELLDAEGNPVLIPDSQFYRKGTSQVIVKIPQNTFEGTFPGKVNTVNGQTFPIPELTYTPPTSGGHWEQREITLFEGEAVFDSWSATLVIDPVKFVDVVEEGIIRVYYKDKGDDFNPIYKHVASWGDWAEFQNIINTKTDGYFEAKVTPEVIDELKSEGLRFQGLGFTITSVILSQNMWIEDEEAQKEETIWETETVFDSWSATIVIDPVKFAKAKDGNTIRVFIKDKDDTYNPIFKHVGSWGDWTEFQDIIKKESDEFFESKVTEAVLEELQKEGLRFQGVGFTLVEVHLIP